MSTPIRANASRVQSFFDPQTATVTYLVFDPSTRDAVVIDPVLDFDPVTKKTSTESIAQVASFVDAHRLRPHYVLETHAHADHISASQWLKERYGAKIAIGARITEVQRTFKKVLALPDDFATDGSQFDVLLDDGAVVHAGSLRVETIATPGHTPACMTFVIDGALFTGDALFVEDYGTGRCDFPSGSASELYRSVHDRLYALPDATRVYVGHDYQPGGRELRFESTIGIEKRANVQLRAETSAEEFIRFREARDKKLDPPRLLLQSVRANIEAGRTPTR